MKFLALLLVLFLGRQGLAVGPAERCQANFVKPHFQVNVSQFQDHALVEAAYLKARESMAKSAPNGIPLFLGLGQRYVEGEAHAQLLVKLGFEVAHLGDQTYLMPPQDFWKLLQNALNLIKELVDQKQIEPTELMMPAMLFKRKDLLQKNVDYFARPDYHKLVRIGLDDWPDPTEWEPWLDFGEMPHEKWEDFYVLGGSPISLTRFLNHDLAHLTEFIQNAALMKATRRAYQTYNSQTTALEGRALNVNDSFLSVYPSNRVFIVSEMIALPDLEKQKAFQEATPYLYSDKVLRFREELENYYQKIPEETFAQHLDFFLNHGQRFVLRHGAALRDGRNFEASIGDETIASFLALRSVPTLACYSLENLLGLQRQMIYLKKLRDHWKFEKAYFEKLAGEHQDTWSGNLLKMSDSSRKTFLNQLLARKLSQFIWGLKVGYEFNIRPEQAVTELHRAKALRGEPLYQFFDAFTEPTSKIRGAVLRKE